MFVLFIVEINNIKIWMIQTKISPKEISSCLKINIKIQVFQILFESLNEYRPFTNLSKLILAHIKVLKS